jgi:hypothetical protein
MRNEAEHHVIHAGRARFGELGNVRDADDVSATLPFARWTFIHLGSDLGRSLCWPYDGANAAAAVRSWFPYESRSADPMVEGCG